MSADQGTPLAGVADMILKRLAKLPKEALDSMPRDGAVEHDHYIYGKAKRAE